MQKQGLHCRTSQNPGRTQGSILAHLWEKATRFLAYAVSSTDKKFSLGKKSENVLANFRFPTRTRILVKRACLPIDRSDHI